MDPCQYLELKKSIMQYKQTRSAAQLATSVLYMLNEPRLSHLPAALRSFVPGRAAIEDYDRTLAAQPPSQKTRARETLSLWKAALAGPEYLQLHEAIRAYRDTRYIEPLTEALRGYYGEKRELSERLLEMLRPEDRERVSESLRTGPTLTAVGSALPTETVTHADPLH